MNISRYVRSFAVAAIPLFLIAGAALAASGHVSLVSDPTSGPAAGSTEAAGVSGNPVLEGTKESEASESPEATKAPGANESAEPSRAPEANESAEPKATGSMDNDSSKDKDGDAAHGASAGTHQGDSDGNGGSGDGDGHGKVGQPGPSGAPGFGGGAPGSGGGDH